MIRYVIFALAILLNNAALAQDHARGISPRGGLGNVAKVVYLPKGTPISEIAVVKLNDRQAFVNAGQSQGIAIGQVFKMARQVQGKWIEVGEVKVLASLKTEAVVEMISANDMPNAKPSKLQLGDRLVKK